MSPRIFLLSLLLCSMTARADETEAPGGLHGDALLRSWVQPEYPAEARKRKLVGEVVVDFIVDAEGRVTTAQIAEASDALFEEPALAAVRQWTFAPALEDDRAVACGMTVRIEFSPAQRKQQASPGGPQQARFIPRAAAATPARAVRAPDPDYPEELEASRLPGEVHLEFIVDEAGRFKQPRVLWASHPAFVEESLRAAERSVFEPARQGLLVKSATVRYPVVFRSLGAKREEMLAAAGIAVGASVDSLPEPLVLNDPVHPVDSLLRRESGHATAKFILDTKGLPTGIELTEASAPEFAAALEAAIETWAFKPAQRDGARVPVEMTVRREFAVPTEGPVFRLLHALSVGGVGSAKGLDAPLRPLWRGFPAYPEKLLSGGTRGEATIEFIIDQGGRCRMPRVISATRQEFGAAAAMAVSQWVFERPKRNGVPANVQVQISIGFNPPQ